MLSSVLLDTTNRKRNQMGNIQHPERIYLIPIPEPMRLPQSEPVEPLRKEEPVKEPEKVPA